MASCSSEILSLPLWQEGGVSDISLSQGRGAGSERSEAPLLLSVDALGRFVYGHRPRNSLCKLTEQINV